ncbi:hypothetical protein PENTCL1PPCAC_21681, partial [Pristionchus entomophagus]
FSLLQSFLSLYLRGSNLNEIRRWPVFPTSICSGRAHEEKCWRGSSRLSDDSQFVEGFKPLAITPRITVTTSDTKYGIDCRCVRVCSYGRLSALCVPSS